MLIVAVTLLPRPKISAPISAPNGVPLAEDHGRQADEAQAVGHPRVEDIHRFQGEPGAAQTGDQPADQHVDRSAS